MGKKKSSPDSDKPAPQNREKTGDRNQALIEAGKATQFQPGQSGNPGGRPKKTLLSDASREWLEQVDEKTGKTNAQLAAEAVGKKLIQGSAEHYRSMGDRTEGKPPQAITIGGSLDLDIDNVDARIKQLAAKIRERKK